MRKNKLQQVFDTLPEDVDLDALLERLYLLKKIEVAEEELAQGQGVSHEDVKKHLESWLE
ncbi:MAG: hypothetical protein ACLQNE_17425 [Thermoguttaceae bacterium]|jgi:hypothetical protein